MTVPLSRELRKRFGRRAVPVRKGDTVRVLSGSFVGREERVAVVDRRDYALTLDNVTAKAADEKMKPLPIRPAHLVITRLNLSDPWRRRSLRVREEDVTAEERGEAEATEDGPEGASTEEPTVTEPKAPDGDDPSQAPEADTPPEKESTRAPRPRSRRPAKAAAEPEDAP